MLSPGGKRMKLTEDIKPVTYMKTRAAELLREVKQSRRPVVITQHGEAQAVVMDVTTYEELRNATLLIQLAAQGEADIQAGRTVPQAEVFERLRHRRTRVRGR
jgi:prevent-host-death family protein